MAFETDVFANGDFLVVALGELGFSDITRGEKLPLQGRDWNDARITEIACAAAIQKTFIF